MRALAGEEPPDEHGLAVLLMGVNVIFGFRWLHTLLADLSTGGADGQDLGVMRPRDLMCRPAALILPWMLTPRSALTRSLALLTPLCMIWMFAACVSLCAEHVALDAGGDEARSVGTPGYPGTQGCCPVGEASCGLPAHRATFVSHVSAAVPTPEAAAVPAADFAPAHPARGVPPDGAADPPFERLRTLRI